VIFFYVFSRSPPARCRLPLDNHNVFSLLWFHSCPFVFPAWLQTFDTRIFLLTRVQRTPAICFIIAPMGNRLSFQAPSASAVPFFFYVSSFFWSDPTSFFSQDDRPSSPRCKKMGAAPDGKFKTQTSPFFPVRPCVMVSPPIRDPGTHGRTLNSRATSSLLHFFHFLTAPPRLSTRGHRPFLAMEVYRKPSPPVLGTLSLLHLLFLAPSG